jgi:hypothetical protein
MSGLDPKLSATIPVEIEILSVRWGRVRIRVRTRLADNPPRTLHKGDKLVVHAHVDMGTNES